YFPIETKLLVRDKSILRFNERQSLPKTESIAQDTVFVEAAKIQILPEEPESTTEIPDAEPHELSIEAKKTQIEEKFRKNDIPKQPVKAMEPVEPIVMTTPQDTLKITPKQSAFPQVTEAPERDKEIIGYLNRNIKREFHIELLNNKISDPYEFLKIEFPEAEITDSEQTFLITGRAVKEDFFGDLRLKFIRNNDGIDFTPLNDYELSDKILQLSSRESIDLSNLTSDEAKVVADRLPQLIYEHRCLGTRLLNFLLIRDNISTTLVIQNGSRKIYEEESYADLLLLLNEYWTNRQVFFKIDKVKKVNGAIEILGFLIAEDRLTKKNDIAEIRFHLDPKFSIDLIMMVLHPDAEY
ncbi:MAG TPA: hypothetical protein PLD62_06710, partial [Candidatus Cloacimonadota bacterium]|nr:hypothetical protein [Candidatus Cloacimonadota bacterium]